MSQEITNLTFNQILALPLAEKENLGLIHTPQEIFQQPETWKETFQIVKNKEVAIQHFLQKSGFGNEKFSFKGRFSQISWPCPETRALQQNNTNFTE